MSRNVRATKTKGRDCEGKKRHPSRKAAQGHLDRLIRHGAAPGALHVYECAHCNNYASGQNGWHVGHKPGTRGRR